MGHARMTALIEPKDLKGMLGTPNLRLLDASYNLPPSQDGIPGALDFDIDDIADPQAPLAHTVPSAEVFAAKVSALGIRNDDLVVVYDRAGLSMAAARAWWMFRLFGHDNVKVLNGGLPAWVATKYPLAKKGPARSPSTYIARFRPELLKTKEQMLENIGAKDFAVLDARDAMRFHTTAGHIPGSVNVHYAQLIQPDGRLKEKQGLSSALQALAPINGQIACTCGSGVTACVIALALYELGSQNAAIYDGSWTEWGSDPRLPKEKGA